MRKYDERARNDFIIALRDKITIAESLINASKTEENDKITIAESRINAAGKTKLDPEIKAKWLEALRSGKYEQGKGCLRDPEGKYCCLGVLADVVDPEGWGNPFTSLFDEDEIPLFDEEDEIYFRDPNAWYGQAATASGPQPVLNDLIQVCLYEMNDSGLFTFEDLANIIEEYL